MKLILICLFFTNVFIYAQLESISIDNSVYPFLRQLKIQNVIPEYNDNKIPLSKEDILGYFTIIDLKILILEPIPKITLSGDPRLYSTGRYTITGLR